MNIFRLLYSECPYLATGTIRSCTVYPLASSECWLLCITQNCPFEYKYCISLESFCQLYNKEKRMPNTKWNKQSSTSSLGFNCFKILIFNFLASTVLKTASDFEMYGLEKRLLIAFWVRARKLIFWQIDILFVIHTAYLVKKLCQLKLPLHCIGWILFSGWVRGPTGLPRLV